MIIFHNFEHSPLLTSLIKKNDLANQLHVALLSFHKILL